MKFYIGDIIKIVFVDNKIRHFIYYKTNASFNKEPWYIRYDNDDFNRLRIQHYGNNITKNLKLN